MFITTATITEQKPRSTLLQSWRKNRQASPLWEGAFKKTGRSYSPKFRFSISQYFTQCEASASPCFTRSGRRGQKRATSAQRKTAFASAPDNCSTIAQRPCTRPCFYCFLFSNSAFTFSLKDLSVRILRAVKTMIFAPSASLWCPISDLVAASISFVWSGTGVSVMERRG